MAQSGLPSEGGRIHPQTAIGGAALTVTNLRQSERFYVDILGLTPVARDAGTVALGAGGVPLVVLDERPDAPAKPRRSTGLYHVAILVPSRRDLADVLRRILDGRYRLDGAADHLVSEALYLSDPDGNGVEIAFDRPSSTWPRSAEGVRMTTESLDLAALLAEADTPRAADADARTVGAGVLPPGTRVGHVHLHVRQLAAAEHFYRELIGFDVTQRSVPGALFVAAGGYHHHVGLNTWAGIAAPPPPKGALGLIRYAITVPTADAMQAVAERLRASGSPVTETSGSGSGSLDTRDPDSTAVRLTQGASLDVASALALASRDAS